MKNNLTTLKVKSPLVGAFLEDWLDEYEGRTFDLSDTKDQTDFADALSHMVKHGMHTSSKGKISVLFDDENGVQTIFVHFS